MNIRKARKLIKTPGLFFRDFLNKKYPINHHTEVKLSEEEEQNLIETQFDYFSSIKLENCLDIDVVFTWVNDKDSEWRSKFNTAKGILPDSQAGLYAKDSARFSNHNELYYSLRSVKKHIPWVRNIYIVTDNQKPGWYTEVDYPNVHIIDHNVIIDKQYLPTFNSHVIEAHLHNIPGLSENFIYFNDDVFIARDLPKTHFFRANGIASIFLAKKNLSDMVKKGVQTPTLHASSKGAALLATYYHQTIDNTLVHTYVPLKKSSYQQAWVMFHDEIKSFLSHKFRTNHDLNMATFLVPWLMYFEKKSIPMVDICYYFNIRTANALSQYKKLLLKQKQGRQPHSFCANDFHSGHTIPNYQNKLIEMLDIYFKD
ncbi:Stealth CR1 domain-containing protein [Testudinibacter aquarius]|nr:Stealth CR1 domain-containing protein [Testudinibacter aquarius]